MSILFDQNDQEDSLKDLFKSDNTFGKYRIEITFEFRRSSRGPSPCFLGVYKSNRSPDLDMDTPLFFCSGEKETDGCGCVLTGDDLIATLEDGSLMKVLYCETCKKYVNKALTSSHLFLHNTKKDIAARAYKLFCELNRDCDIVLIYTNRDFKKASEHKYGELLEKARQREVALYKLGNLVKDVSAGESAVLKKIEDFISV